MIYLNAASHGLPSDATLRRMEVATSLERLVGPAAAAEQAQTEIDALRHELALLVGGSADGIGLATTTSLAWEAIIRDRKLTGCRVLVAEHEWGANVAFLRQLADGEGVQLVPMPPPYSENLEAWRAAIDAGVGAIVMPMVTSIAGQHYPVDAVGNLERPADCFFIVDAAQAVGQMEIDVRAMGCDAMVATGRKWLRGPREAAFFWMDPLKFDQVRIRAIEPFDLCNPAVFGLAQAVRNARDTGLSGIAAEIHARAAHLRRRASEFALPLRPEGATGIVAFDLPLSTREALTRALRQHEIVAKFPDSGTDEPLAAQRDEGTFVLRVSPHTYNTFQDLDLLCTVLHRALVR